MCHQPYPPTEPPARGSERYIGRVRQAEPRNMTKESMPEKEVLLFVMNGFLSPARESLGHRQGLLALSLPHTYKILVP